MEDLLVPITVVLIFVVGTLLYFSSRHYPVSSVLLFALAGIIFGSLSYNGSTLIYISGPLLNLITSFLVSVFAFVLFSKLNFNSFDTLGYRALRFSSVLMLICIIIIPYLAYHLLHLNSPVLLLFLALALCATGEEVFSDRQKDHGHIQNRLTGFLSAESKIAAPAALAFSFLLIFFVQNMPDNFFSFFHYKGGVMPALSALAYSFEKLFISAGVGLVFSIIVLGIMRKRYHPRYSALFLITAVVLSYLFAEYLSAGSGIVSAAVMGLFYGNSRIKEKSRVSGAADSLGKAALLSSLLFSGFIITSAGIPLLGSSLFLLASAVSVMLFSAVVALRLVVSFVLLPSAKYNIKERLFIGLNMPLGSAAVAILFGMVTFFPPISSAVGQHNLTVVCLSIFIIIILSHLLSSILLFFLYYFTGKKRWER